MPSCATSTRDETGQFTATYNRARARNGETQGPAFRSVRDRRREVDLRRLRLARASLPTITRKWKGLMMSPVLSPTGRLTDLGDYRGSCGIREITGIAYGEDTLDRIMVHSEMGTPLYWEIFSGHASLVTHTLPMLERLEAVVGHGWMVDRLIVIDGEGDVVGLFKQFDDAKPKPRWFVTILGEGRVKSLEDVQELTEWQPYRSGEEIAGGYMNLLDSKDRKADPYRLRVAVIRRRSGRGKLKALGSNAPSNLYEPQQLADAYFRRWPAQELRFRDFSQATRFKRSIGQGKRLVMNIAVLTEKPVDLLGRHTTSACCPDSLDDCTTSLGLPHFVEICKEDDLGSM